MIPDEKRERIEKDLEKLNRYRRSIGTLDRVVRLMETGADGLTAMSRGPDREKIRDGDRDAARLHQIKALKERQEQYRAFVEYYDWLLALLPEDERVALELMVLDESPDMLKRASDALRRGPSALYRIKARALAGLAELADEALGAA